MTLEEYARKILADARCDEYTYGGEGSKFVLDDLKEIFTPEEMLYPYVDVANAILAISKVRPIKRANYIVIMETESDTVEAEADTYSMARELLLDCYAGWMTEEIIEWEDIHNPTDKQKEDWNYMVENCCVTIQKYNPQIDEYEDIPYDDNDDALDVYNMGWRLYE